MMRGRRKVPTSGGRVVGRHFFLPCRPFLLSDSAFLSFSFPFELPFRLPLRLSLRLFLSLGNTRDIQRHEHRRLRAPALLLSKAAKQKKENTEPMASDGDAPASSSPPPAPTPPTLNPDLAPSAATASSATALDLTNEHLPTLDGVELPETLEVRERKEN